MNVGKFFARLRNWRRDREAIAELLGQPDRELSDIGVYRGTVVDAVEGRLRSIEG